MKNQALISIFIICKNEERIIEKCLIQASKIASEIIVVDSGSEDATLEIAQKYTSNIVQHDWEGYAKQKNFALNLCTNEWVFNLDADEILTDELIEEIRNLDLNSTKYTDTRGFKVARRLFIGDKFIRYGGYFPDYQLRLFRKSFGRFADDIVHESVEVMEPTTGLYTKNYDKKNILKLKQPLNHYAYTSIDEMKLAFDRYAQLANSAKNDSKKGFAKAFVKYLYTFLYKYFFRLGLLHGLLGLQLASIHARYAFKKYRNLIAVVKG